MSLIKEKGCYNSDKSTINKMNVKNILLAFLVQFIFDLSLFAADPILLNCIETPGIYDLETKPKSFNSSNNLRRKPGSPNNAAGELINVVGRVTDVNCLPIQNAVVSIWHADSLGMSYYDENVELDPNFAGSGRFVVNNLGYYNFITIVPGKIGDRAPYINFLVQHPDFPEFTTQMFFADHNCDNCDDLLLGNLIESGLASLLIAPFTYNNQAMKTYTFNITLGGHNKFSDKR
ncbi:protocatechuate 3,4-dioxygenase [Wolbachia endosymbiont of Aedes aegypti]|nr:MULTISPECIES: protocatechuate 3,4-dioxygenase [Wolbachia]UYC23564.1 protocatechuate 3,4-dioxygenase [Wolbachia endosymbiont of Aedes aegypti]CCE77965.1 putative Dioxygenase [Wolbachia pipientis wAlbB]